MIVNVYQSDLTGHWIVDKHGTKENPGSARQGWRSLHDALAYAWTWVTGMPNIYKDVRVQR
jgi:hypothetical protein